MTICRVVLLIATLSFVSAVQFVPLNSTRIDEDRSNAPSPMDRITNLTLSTVKRCLDSSDSVECLRQKFLKALDLAIRDNGTWRINEYVAFERSPDYELHTRSVEGLGRSEQVGDDTVTGKLSQLLQSRRVQFHTNLVPSGASEGNYYIHLPSRRVLVISDYYRSQKEAQTRNGWRRRNGLRRHRHGRPLRSSCVGQDNHVGRSGICVGQDRPHCRHNGKAYLLLTQQFTNKTQPLSAQNHIADVP